MTRKRDVSREMRRALKRATEEPMTSINQQKGDTGVSHWSRETRHDIQRASSPTHSPEPETGCSRARTTVLYLWLCDASKTKHCSSEPATTWLLLYSKSTFQTPTSHTCTCTRYTQNLRKLRKVHSCNGHFLVRTIFMCLDSLSIKKYFLNKLNLVIEKNLC